MITQGHCFISCYNTELKGKKVTRDTSHDFLRHGLNVYQLSLTSSGYLGLFNTRTAVKVRKDIDWGLTAVYCSYAVH